MEEQLAAFRGNGKKRGVLLIEDDSMIGENLEEALRTENYAIDWARDGRAAELAIASHTYDIILLDLGLPKKQGIEILIDRRPPILSSTLN